MTTNNLKTAYWHVFPTALLMYTKWVQKCQNYFPFAVSFAPFCLTKMHLEIQILKNWNIPKCLRCAGYVTSCLHNSNLSRLSNNNFSPPTLCSHPTVYIFYTLRNTVDIFAAKHSENLIWWLFIVALLPNLFPSVLCHLNQARCVCPWLEWLLQLQGMKINLKMIFLAVFSGGNNCAPCWMWFSDR